ncbi:MAG: hypothetical protein R3C11_17345 [Planctomycetaceae bacterium]
MYTKLIGHIDSDCFYVSAERVRAPHFKGVPCGVLGNQGACVIAKSYELKAYGVKTGMPIWEAVEVCPNAVFIKRDFRWYEVISRQMLNLLKQVSPVVEYYSIDEMFFDADELSRIYKCPVEQAAFRLQEEINQKIGIPVSIGIAPSKTLAKLCSDSAKPYGCRTLFGKDEEFLQSQPVGNCVVSVGAVRKNYSDSASTPVLISPMPTGLKSGTCSRLREALWYELHGERVTPIVTRRPTHKAVARGGSIGRKSKDRERIISWLTRNTERLSEALNQNQMHAQLLTLSIQYEDNTGWGQVTKLDEPTSSFDDLITAAKRMIAHMPLTKCVSYMHLISERLTPQKSDSAIPVRRPSPSPSRSVEGGGQRKAGPVYRSQRRHPGHQRALRRRSQRLRHLRRRRKMCF